MSYPVVLFDLDGTLTDPTEGITKSVQYALSKFGITSELDELRAFIGPPLLRSFMTSYDFDEATAWQAVESYREYFAERGIYENRIFDGVPELLLGLRGADGQLCVVTSKPAVYAEQIVGHFGLTDHFDAVIGPGMDLADADKALLVRRAIDRYPEHEPTDFVMIGDREHDIIGARTNGIDSIGVTYGAGSREELTAAAATHVVDTLDELRATLLNDGS